MLRPAVPGAPVFEAKGPGTVLWDVGFVDVASKPTVAFTRTRLDGAGQPMSEAFDFPAHRYVAANPDARIDRAVKRYAEWTVATPQFDRLTVSGVQGDPISIQLDSESGRWTSYTFIPPNAAAGHAKPTLAVGCRTGGIMIYSLPDRSRTRVFQGHLGAVYGLAPSADGRWLASVSTDLTVRLWRLSGCDSRPAPGSHARGRRRRKATGSSKRSHFAAPPRRWV